MTATAPEARLLVVEDEPNIRELLATSLRFAGFEVHAAGDGADRPASWPTEHEPDLVVLDVMLPDMDGFTVTRRLRDTRPPAARSSSSPRATASTTRSRA